MMGKDYLARLAERVHTRVKGVYQFDLIRRIRRAEDFEAHKAT